MRTEYDVIYVGATVFSAGAADENSLIIDAGYVVAPEYASAFRGSVGRGAVCGTEAGEAYRRELLERGVLTDRGCSPAPCGPVTAAVLARKATACWFGSRVTAIERGNDGFRVEAVHHGTVYVLRARRIVDTTAAFSIRGLSPDAPEPKLYRKLNALLVWNGEAPGAEALREIWPEMSFADGACRDETILQMTFRSETLMQAQEALLRRWKERPTALERCRLVSMGSEFDVAAQSGGLEAEGLWWIPPSEFADPVEAFDAGVRFCCGDLPVKLSRSEIAFGGTEIIDHGAYDVIVAGLGTAGAVAAARAASLGLRVLGVENLSLPGGTGTAGMVRGNYYGIKGGYYKKIDHRAALLTDRYGAECTDLVSKAMALEHDMLENGATLCYRAMFAGVELDGKRVTGIRWADDRGIHCAKSRFVIDCTADNDVCIVAGCAMIGGQALGGHYQPYSNVCRSYDAEKNAAWTGNIDDGVVDQYDPDAFGRSVLAGASSFLHLREDYSGAVRYAGVSALTGLREGLKIVGEDTADFSGFCRGIPCAEPVYCGYSNLDNHAKDDAFESREYRDWITVCSMWGWNVVIPVPKGALIPKGYDGLLAAGRGVSVDHDFATGLRMKDDVQKSGEAAAALAYLALRGGCRAAEVPYGPLKALLEETGCLAGVPEGFCSRQVDGTGRMTETTAPAWYADPHVILEELSTARPGFALWSAKLLDGARGAELEALLARALEGGKDVPAFALALALRGNGACGKWLMEMIAQRRDTAPEEGWTHNNLDCVAAVSAAGRLGLAEAAPLLEEILEDEGCADGIRMDFDGTGYEFMTSQEDIRYQLASHSAMALYEIATRHPEFRERARAAILRWAESGHTSVSMVTRRDLRLDTAAAARELVCRLADG